MKKIRFWVLPLLIILLVQFCGSGKSGIRKPLDVDPVTVPAGVRQVDVYFPVLHDLRCPAGRRPDATS